VSWISRHRQGFVVDGTLKTMRKHLMLHRARCSAIKPHRRARLTTAGHIKACSVDAVELAAWAQEQAGGVLTACRECHPDQEDFTIDRSLAKHGLTRLGAEALSYVLELAVMYLDGEESRFEPTIQDIGASVGKTAAQIAPAIHRLIEDGYLESGAPAAANVVPLTATIYPTPKSLRTIPAFGEMFPESLDAELKKLRSKL